MKIIKKLVRFLEKILSPDYGVYERGTFLIRREFSLSRAKSLILAASKKNPLGERNRIYPFFF